MSDAQETPEEGEIPEEEEQYSTEEEEDITMDVDFDMDDDDDGGLGATEELLSALLATPDGDTVCSAPREATLRRA